MKTIATIIIYVFSVLSINVFGQDFSVKHPSNNQHIGFGHSTKIDTMLTLVINGPLFHNDSTIVGGYVDNFIQKRPFVDPKAGRGNFKGENTIYGRLDNGIFGLTAEGVMVMVPYFKWDNSIKLVWGFQNGRMLVLDGQNIHKQSSSHLNFRSGIGFKSDGSLVYILSNKPMRFWDIAQEFIEQGCINAIYLDGFPDQYGPCGYADQYGRVGMNSNAIKIQFFH